MSQIIDTTTVTQSNNEQKEAIMTIITKNLNAEQIAGLFMFYLGLSKDHFRAVEEPMEEIVIPEEDMFEQEREEAFESKFREWTKDDKEQEKWVQCDKCEGAGKMQDEEDGRWYRCGECKGRGGWLDDRSSVNASFTLSGDINSDKDWFAAFLQNEIPRNMRELPPVNKYSAAKMYWKAESNDEGKVCLAILAADKIKDKTLQKVRLTKLWKAFWQRYFAWAENGQHWLSPRAMKRITKEFNKRGIMSVAQREAKRLAALAK